MKCPKSGFKKLIIWSSKAILNETQHALFQFADSMLFGQLKYSFLGAVEIFFIIIIIIIII